MRGSGKRHWNVSRDRLGLIEAAGPEPTVIQTPGASFELQPGGDWLVVAKESYLRMVTDLGVFRDWEKRALASASRRRERRRPRDAQP